MLVSPSGDRPSSMEDLIDSATMARLDRLDVRTRKMFPGKLPGERRSKKRGQSVEFDDYRNYVPGDDLRFIDWNVYARLDRLFIKLFLEDEDLAVHVAIDASASMDAGAPNKLRYAARLAMALGYVGLVRQNRVGVSVFGKPNQTRLEHLPDARGRRNVRRLADFILGSIYPQDDGAPAAPGRASERADFNGALTAIARQRVGKGVMVVLSDFLVPEGYEGGLRALAAAGGYDTYCVQLLAPAEVEPERAAEDGIAGDLRLTDIETGDAREVTVSADLIKAYKRRLETYCTDLGSFCRSREMTHLLVRTDTEQERLIMETFRKRGLLA